MGVALLYAAAHFLHLGEALATLPSGVAIDATIVIGLAGTVARVCAFRLHRHDLRVPAVPARVGDTAHRRQLRPAGQRVRVRTRRRVRDVGRPGTRPVLRGGGARRSRCSDSPVAPRRSSATRDCARNPRCRRPSESSTRESSRSRRDSWAARSTPASSFTAGARRSSASIKWFFLLGAFALPALLLAAGSGGRAKGNDHRRVRRPVRRPPRGALVLLRAVQPPAEHLLSGDRLMVCDLQMSTRTAHQPCRGSR